MIGDIGDLIVLSSAALAALFTIAWMIRPDLRDWIERPKYGFQARVEHYDRISWAERDSRMR